MKPQTYITFCEFKTFKGILIVAILFSFKFIAKQSTSRSLPILRTHSFIHVARFLRFSDDNVTSEYKNLENRVTFQIWNVLGDDKCYENIYISLK